MKKIFFILIISFFSLFGFWIIAEAKDCDAGNIVCGGFAKCEETTTQSGCSAVCDIAHGFGGWAWPLCDCKLKTEGISECKCACNSQCADDWCKGSGRYKGICKDGIGICCDAIEEFCDNGIDEDCDNKTDCKDDDCEGKVCGTNKECKGGSCVEKVLLIPCPSALDCTQMTYACLCGAKEREVGSGEFCFTPLSKKYTLKSECDADYKPICPEDSENPMDFDCFCGSKLIKAEDGYYCFEKKIYTSKELYEKAKKGEKPPSGWIFTCPEKRIECPTGAFCIGNPLCAESFEQLINALINFIFYFALAIAPIMFIIAGLLFITAAGVPEKIQKAKNVVLWTVIGLAIVIMAKGIITVIQEIFGG